MDDKITSKAISLMQLANSQLAQAMIDAFVAKKIAERDAELLAKIEEEYAVFHYSYKELEHIRGAKHALDRLKSFLTQSQEVVVEATFHMPSGNNAVRKLELDDPTVTWIKATKKPKYVNQFGDTETVLCVNMDGCEIPFVAWWNKKNKKWTSAEYSSDNNSRAVTHWMYLPKLP